MDYVVRSDRGLKRPVNEDCAAVFEHPHIDAALAVVADGMGGHKGGDYASHKAVEMIGEVFLAVHGEIENEQDWFDLLYEALVDVNSFLYKAAVQDESFKGMGTTLDVALLLPAACLILHVGDSRVYQIAGKAIQQITKDHSFVNALLDSGEITVQEAEVHPQRNWIMKAVGSEKSIVPDLQTLSLQPGSALLLCTDGLSNKIDNEEMLDIMQCSAALEEKADTFIRTANERGGEDNITVIIIEIPENGVAV